MGFTILLQSFFYVFNFTIDSVIRLFSPGMRLRIDFPQAFF